MKLPEFDLSAARTGDLASRRHLAHAIDEACRRHGFFYVTGHGIDSGLRDDVFAQARAFFALPLQTKSRWHVRHSGIMRGYDPFGWQSLDQVNPPTSRRVFTLVWTAARTTPWCAAVYPIMVPTSGPMKRWSRGSRRPRRPMPTPWRNWVACY
jgi:isopenicillin N synthase-like dioxygenase